MTEPVDPMMRTPADFTWPGATPGEQDLWIASILRVDSPMPPAVWDRLASALLAESALRDSHGPFEGGDSVTLLATRRPKPRLFVGVVAAAAVLIAAGVLGSLAQNSGGESGAIVAADAPRSASEAPAALSGAQQNSVSTGEISSPARRVMASGIDYKPDTMTGDVQQVIDTIGASTAKLMADVQPDASPTEGSSGFTSSLPSLKSCLAWLTGSDRVQALLVDRASYQGAPAAVVVVPASPGGPLLSSLDVWVVTLDCVQSDSSILGHHVVSLTSN